MADTNLVKNVLHDWAYEELPDRGRKLLILYQGDEVRGQLVLEDKQLYSMWIQILEEHGVQNIDKRRD
jgi:hypothetical protein